VTVEFFSFSRTSLATLTNVETIVAVPPQYLSGGRLPSSGSVKRQTGSGRVRYDGARNVDITFDKLTRTEYRNLLIAMLGDDTTNSSQIYISWVNDVGLYMPMWGWVDRPKRWRDFTPTTMTGVVFPFHDLILQSTTVSANHTVGLAERFIYGDTSAGNVTLTLPPAATATTYSIYSSQKYASANSLILDGDGAELIDGASTKTLTDLYGQLDFYTDGTAWYSTANSQ